MLPECRFSIDIFFAERLVSPAFFMVVVGTIVRLAALAIFLVGQIITSLAIVAAGLAGRPMVIVGTVRLVLADLGALVRLFCTVVSDFSAVLFGDSFALGSYGPFMLRMFFHAFFLV